MLFTFEQSSEGKRVYHAVCRVKGDERRPIRMNEIELFSDTN